MRDAGSFRQELIVLLPRFRRFALVLCRNHADADDLVQAAIERALAKEDKWQPGTRLDSWMYKIIQNIWRDDRRSYRHRGEVLDPEHAGEDGRATSAAKLDAADVRSAMLNLPEDQRTVLALVVLDQMSYAEAAQILQTPIGTVMSRLSRARSNLAALLANDPIEST